MGFPEHNKTPNTTTTMNSGCSQHNSTMSLPQKSFQWLNLLNENIQLELKNQLQHQNSSSSSSSSSLPTIDIDSPPDVSRRMIESLGNLNNEYYNYNPSNANTTNTNQKPWKKHPYYFQTVNLSLLSMMKMTMHAISGGSIEIMGMLVGFHKDNEIIITDCYPLPVQGTESRVNPQNDSYEFMLSYITKLQESGLKRENIIGWYHSHPGFGCWLSGIDVQTQKLHQGFEDPYVAIVVDPMKSIKSGIVDIGAFRTLADDHIKKEGDDSGLDLGWYSKEYYALNVKVFVNDHDREILPEFTGFNPRAGLLQMSVNDFDKFHYEDDSDDYENNQGDDRDGDGRDPDYDGIKTWKKVNKVLDSISLNSYNDAYADNDEEIKEASESIISVESKETEIGGPTNFAVKVVNDFNLNMTTTEEPNNTFENDNTKRKRLQNEQTRSILGKVGLDMDMVAAEEMKKYLARNVQRRLFE